MNIAIFTNNYLPNPYGVTGSIESFRVALTALGHTVYVFAPAWKDHVDHDPLVYRYPSIETSFKFRFPLSVPFSPQTTRILNDLDIDIIHAQHPNLIGSAARYWARNKNIPLVFTWHTLYDHYAHYAPFLPRAMASALVVSNAVRYANKADHVIVPTPSVRDIIARWGVTNTHVSDVATGVDPTEFTHSSARRVYERHAIATDQIIVLTTARLSKEKNILFLFDVMCRVVKAHAHVTYIIISGGDLLEALQEKARARGVADRIIFTGEISRASTPDYYAAADLFVYASQSETQGMVITEAMYNGVPVVALDGPGVRDLVRDGEMGRLVTEPETFFTAVKKLINNAQQRAVYGERAREIALTEYVNDVCAKKLVTVYTEVRQEYKKKHPQNARKGKNVQAKRKVKHGA